MRHGKITRDAQRKGVNWIFHRLAFAEQTRDRVEVHMKRPTPYVYLDLVALDAVTAMEKADRKVAEDKAKARR